jgi:hypothetical protein
VAQFVHMDSGGNTIEVDAAVIGAGLKIDPRPFSASCASRKLRVYANEGSRKTLGYFD